jgi:hypothetical protein
MRKPTAEVLKLRPLADVLSKSNPDLVHMLAYCRRIWDARDRALIVQVLVDRYTQDATEYGLDLVLRALHMALVTDVARLAPDSDAAILQHTATALRALADAHHSHARARRDDR